MNTYKTKEFEEFYKKFIIRNYKKGEMLIRADDDPQGIFYLKSGYVRQYTISKAGFELTLHILKPVSYFPMVWAVNGTPNVYYFEALTPVEVGRAPRDEVVNFIKDKPTIIFELLSELIEDYAESLKRIENLVFSDAYRRVISVLIYISKHFGEKSGNGILITHRFTQQDIATLVGVARETASNEMVKLEKKGLLKYKDHLILLENVKKLNTELSSSHKKT
jgi:CRP/FNR family transcriptional regulator